jgi:hypothetical protein
MPNHDPQGLGSEHNEYTVIFCYREPPSMWCDGALAATPADALNLAWEACRDANGWDEDTTPEDQLTDAIVIRGAVHVEPDNYWSWTEARAAH